VGCATEIFRDKRVRTQEVGRVLQRFLGKKTVNSGIKKGKSL